MQSSELITIGQENDDALVVQSVPRADDTVKLDIAGRVHETLQDGDVVKSLDIERRLDAQMLAPEQKIEKSEREMTVAERVDTARLMTGVKIVKIFSVMETVELRMILTREDLESARWRVVTEDEATRHLLRTSRLYYASADKNKEGLDVLATPRKGGMEELKVLLSRRDFAKEGPLKVRVPAPTSADFNMLKLKALQALYGGVQFLPARGYDWTDYADFSGNELVDDVLKTPAPKKSALEGGNMDKLQMRLSNLPSGEKLKIKLPPPDVLGSKWKDMLVIKAKYQGRVELLAADNYTIENYMSRAALNDTKELPSLKHQVPTSADLPVQRVDYKKQLEGNTEAHRAVKQMIGREFEPFVENKLCLRLSGIHFASDYAKVIANIETHANTLRNVYGIQEIFFSVMTREGKKERSKSLVLQKPLHPEAEQVHKQLEKLSREMGGRHQSHLRISSKAQ